MTLMFTPGFTGSRLDRADHLREDEAALAALRNSRDACLLLLDGLDPLIDDAGTLGWGDLSGASTGAELALLGMIDGRPHFVALEEVPHGAGRSSRLWHAMELMPPEEASTFAAARSLVDWHNRHRYCAQCGTPTTVSRGGWARKCGRCEAQHFPRTDPVVIMLAEYGDSILLGRQPQFPEGRYSALAGFVEVGESIEEAVIRELKEEAGVEASAVRYIASQPWPFPSSLMIACLATAVSDTITLDTRELEHAMWCHRDQVRAALAGDPAAPFIAPPAFAVAHTLLAVWAAG